MFRKLIGSVFGLALFAMAGPAHAVLFDITGASFTPGTGYGVDASETSSPTLLNVVFASTFTAQNFNLNSVGATSTFDFGTVNFLETNTGGGIVAAETDTLGVVANFVFTNPLGSTEMVSAVGTATTGSVSDSGVDYTLVWTPITVNFGTGGSFEIDLLDLSYTTTDIKTVTATITLLTLPTVTPPIQIPEPEALVLFGIGLVGLGALGRRRRRNAA